MTVRGLLMAVRGTGPNAEAEPVIATIGDGRLVLELDDGDRIDLSFDEVLDLVLFDHSKTEYRRVA
jgi:hypothetical protein